MTRVVTAGETMALLDPQREGELELGDLLRLRFAGAESNFAVGLARLGVEVAWISRLGADRLGALIRDTLRDEGVDVRWVRTVDDKPTGLFYKWRAGGRTSVAYHRRGSAASGMQPSDVPPEALDGASLVHLTGITLALGEGPRELVLDVARRARAAGAIVTFDPNFRPALWESPAAAEAAIEPVLEHVSWYLCGADDPLFEADDLVERGVEGVVVRTAGSALVVRGGARDQVAAGREAVVDEVGAGDASRPASSTGCSTAGRRARPPGWGTRSPRTPCAAPETGRPCRGGARWRSERQLRLGGAARDWPHGEFRSIERRRTPVIARKCSRRGHSCNRRCTPAFTCT